MKVKIIKSNDREIENFENKVNGEIQKLDDANEKIKDIKFVYGKEGADGYHFAYIILDK